MVVLGVDPGLIRTGYALLTRQRGRYVLLKVGVFRPRPDDPMEQRLLAIHDGLHALAVGEAPDEAAVEAIFRHRSSESALRLGQARGVALLALARAGLAVSDYNAMTVKKSVTGSGTADKAQVQRMVAMLVGQPIPGPPDAADAVAIAITHLAHTPLARRVAQ